MKNIMLQNNRKMLLAMAVLFSAIFLGGASSASAHGGDRDRNGFRDRDGNYHQYGYRHHHRGYWNQHNGVRFWINVG